MRELPLQSHFYDIVKCVLTALQVGGVIRWTKKDPGSCAYRPYPPVGDTDNLSETPNACHHVTDVILRQRLSKAMIDMVFHVDNHTKAV